MMLCIRIVIIYKIIAMSHTETDSFFFTRHLERPQTKSLHNIASSLSRPVRTRREGIE
jgi:hypothetical protein